MATADLDQWMLEEEKVSASVAETTSDDSPSPESSLDMVSKDQSIHTETNGFAHEHNSELHSIMKSVTLSEDEDDDDVDPLSPLSKMYAATSPLSLDPNASYIAMMERYLDVDQYDGSEQKDIDQDVLDSGKEEDVRDDDDLALETVVNLSKSNHEFQQNDDSMHQTPTKDTTTPRRFYKDWKEEGQTFTPRSILKADIIPSDDEEEDEEESGGEVESVGDASETTSQTDLNPSPRTPLSSSPLSTFKSNASHIALDETKVYLRKIKELQDALEFAEDRANEEARRRQSAENRCQALEQQLTRVSPLKTPKTTRSSDTLRTPMSDSLWERNKTLVKEVRFADQTCVELSAQKVALEKEIQQLKDQLGSSNDKNSKLELLISEKNQAQNAAEEQCQAAQTRVKELERKLLETNESLAQMETAQKTIESSLLQEEESEKLSPSVKAERLLKAIKMNEESSVQVVNLRSQLQEEESKREEMLEQHETETLQLQDEIAKKDTELKVSQTTIASLKMSKQLADNKLEKTEGEVSNLLLKIKNVNDELNKERERHNVECSNLREQHDTDFALQTKELKETKLALDAVTREMANTADQLDRTQLELDNLTTSNTKLLEHQHNQSDSVSKQVTVLQSRLEETEKDLVEAQTALVQERTAAAAKEIEIKMETESALERADEQLDIVTQELSKAHQTKVRDLSVEFKTQVAELGEKIRELEKQRDESRSLEASTRKSLSEAVDSLELEKTRLAADLQESKRAMALEVEQMSRLLEEKRQKLEKAETDIEAMKAEARNSSRILAGSIKAAAGEFKRESDELEKSVSSVADTLMSRIVSLSTRINDLENSPRGRSFNSLEAEPSDINPSLSYIESATPFSLSHGLTPQKTMQHSTTSRLLGASFLSTPPDQDREARGPLETPLPAREALNITQDLERMEEAREVEQGHSPAASSIEGLSHLFNGTFLSNDDSPRKTPTKADGGLRQQLAQAKTERDEALDQLDLLRKDHETLKDKVAQMDEMQQRLVSLEGEKEDTAKLLSEAQKEASNERAQRVELEKARDEVSFEKTSLEISMVRMRDEMGRIESLHNNAVEELRDLRSDLDKEKHRFTAMFSEVISTMNGEDGDFNIADLPVRLSELMSELSEVRTSLTSAEASTKALAEERDHFRLRAKERAAKIEELMVSVEGLEQQLDREKERAALVSELVSENSDLGTKLRASETEYESVCVEVKRLNETLSLKTEQSRQLSQEVHNLRTSLANSESRCNRIEDDLRGKCVEAELLSSKIRSTSDQVESAKQTRDDLQRQLQAKEASFDELKVTEKFLHEQLDSSNKLVIKLQADVDRLTSEVEGLSVARSDASRLADSLQESTDEVNRLKEALLKCNERLAERSEVQNRLLSEIETYKEAQASAHNNTVVLSREVTAAKGALAHERRSNQAMLDHLERAGQDVEALSQTAATLLNGAVTPAGLVAGDRRETFANEPYGEFFDSKVKNLGQCLELLREEKSQLDIAQKDLQKQLREKDSTIEEKDQIVEKLKVKCQRLKDYSKKLAARLEEWEVFYEQHVEKIQELRHENEETRKRAIRLDELYRQQEAEWYAEFDEYFSTQHHYEAELEALARELTPPDSSGRSTNNL